MTPKAPPLDLPKIPSLPPIQMPDTSNLFDSTSPRRPSSPSSRPSSGSPYASQDTFLTAHTSLSPDHPSPDGPASPVYIYPLGVPTMSTPTALRKSISVDSFVNYKPSSMAASRQKPPSPLSAEYRSSQADVDRFPAPPSHQSESPASTFRSPWADRDKRSMAAFPPSSRSRGTSVSTTTDDRDLDESDLERSDEFARRMRKGKQAPRTSVRPGELPMPSRLQAKGSVPAMHIGRAGAPPSPSRSSSLSLRASKQKTLVPVHTQSIEVRIYLDRCCPRHKPFFIFNISH